MTIWELALVLLACQAATYMLFIGLLTLIGYYRVSSCNEALKTK